MNTVEALSVQGRTFNIGVLRGRVRNITRMTRKETVGDGFLMSRHSWIRFCDHVLLQSPSGTETPVSIENWNELPNIVREGHEVTLVCATESGKSAVHCLGIYSHDTKLLAHNVWNFWNLVTGDMKRYEVSKTYRVGIGVISVVTLVTWPIGAGLLAHTFWKHRYLRKGVTPIVVAFNRIGANLVAGIPVDQCSEKSLWGSMNGRES